MFVFIMCIVELLNKKVIIEEIVVKFLEVKLIV